MADEEKIILKLEADDEASEKVKNLSKNLQDLDKNAGGVGGSSTSGISNFVSSLERGIGKVNKLSRHYNRVMSGFNRMVINGVQEMGSAVYDFTTDAIDNFTEFSEQHAKTLGAMAADYDMIVLDECVYALSMGLLTEDKVIAFLESKPESLEVVMSGRNPSERLQEHADYISEIKKIKHPFDQGLSSRIGIEK